MKNLIKILFFDKIRTIPVLMIIILLAGFTSLYQLHIQYMPGIDYPVLNVSIGAAGLTPKEIRTNILSPLEKDFRRIKGIKNITSSISRGQLSINIKCELQADLDSVFSSVSYVCEKEYGDFPKNVSKPVVMRFSTDDMPLIVFSIIEYKTEDELTSIKEKISRVEGVGLVEISGNPEYMWNLKIDKEKINMLNISLSLISDTLSRYTKGFTVTSEGKNIIFETGVKNFEEIPEMVVRNLHGEAYYIKDFARIEKEEISPEKISRVDGEETKTGFVFMDSEGNADIVSRDVEKILSSFLNAEIIYNQGEYIRENINTLITALIAGALSSFLFIYAAYRKFKPAFAILIALPVNFGAAFLFMYIRNLSLNVMSLSAFLFSLGMLYDNSVIIIEHFENMIENNPRKSFETLYKYSIKIISPVFISVLTTLCVLIPVFFIRYDLYIMYSDFVHVLSFCLLFSFFQSAFFIPWFTYFFNWRKRDSNKIHFKKYEFFNTFFLSKALFYKKTIIVISILIILTGIISYFFTGFMNIGEVPDNIFLLHCQPGLLTSTQDFRNDLKQVEEILLDYNEVKKVLTTVEKETAQMVVKVHRKELQVFADKYNEIQNRLEEFPDIHIFLMNSPEEEFRKVDLMIYDDNYETRLRKANIVYSQLKEDFGHNSNILIKEKPPVEEVEIKIKHNELIRAGFNASEAAYILRAYFQGPRLDKEMGGLKDEFRFRLDEVNSIEEMGNLLLRKEDFVSLKDVSDISLVHNPGNIFTYNGMPVITISVLFEKLDELNAINKIRNIINKLNVNRRDKIIYEFDSRTSDIKSDRREMGMALLFTLILLFLILYMYYQKVQLVLLVFSVIPVTYGIIISAMALFSIPWSLPVYIAFILLSGIIINNSILIVDYINKDLSHSSFFKATHGINLKFRAVLITTVTTVLGLTPLVFADSFWKIMGIISITGLITGMFCSLYLLPVYYYFFSKPQ
ncbi:MAG: efflux RND transporter permease subunit [Candidatus Muiribacteriota bacterium]